MDLITGTVEEVGNDNKIAFSSVEELSNILKKDRDSETVKKVTRKRCKRK